MMVLSSWGGRAPREVMLELLLWDESVVAR